MQVEPILSQMAARHANLGYVLRMQSPPQDFMEMVAPVFLWKAEIPDLLIRGFIAQDQERDKLVLVRDKDIKNLLQTLYRGAHVRIAFWVHVAREELVQE